MGLSLAYFLKLIHADPSVSFSESENETVRGRNPLIGNNPSLEVIPPSGRCEYVPSFLLLLLLVSRLENDRSIEDKATDECDW